MIIEENRKGDFLQQYSTAFHKYCDYSVISTERSERRNLFKQPNSICPIVVPFMKRGNRSNLQFCRTREGDCNVARVILQGDSREGRSACCPFDLVEGKIARHVCRPVVYRIAYRGKVLYCQRLSGQVGVGGGDSGRAAGAFLGMVQLRQIPSYIVCGSVWCGSLKSEGFGDGCTALGALPSPSLRQAQAGRCA